MIFQLYKIKVTFSYTLQIQTNFTSNGRSFGSPIIYTDTIHNILFTDTSTMLDTTKLIH